VALRWEGTRGLHVEGAVQITRGEFGEAGLELAAGLGIETEFVVSTALGVHCASGPGCTDEGIAQQHMHGDDQLVSLMSPGQPYELS